MRISKTGLLRKVRDFANENGLAFNFVESVIANVAFTQILQHHGTENAASHAVKGGTGILLRVGLQHARLTQDLDISLSSKYLEIPKHILGLLDKSWGPFTIRKIKAEKVGNPELIPQAYRIQRYRIQVGIGSSEWRSVLLEAAVEELQNIEIEHEDLIDEEILELFARCSLPVPSSIPVSPLELQIAQKIHACTEPGSERGHDIYDVYIATRVREPNFALLSKLVDRTFKLRGTHSLNIDFKPSAAFTLQYEKEVNLLEGAPAFQIAFEEFQTLLRKLEI